MQKGGVPTSIWSGSAADLRTQIESMEPFTKSSICFAGSENEGN